jgi:hypothetical protein
MKIKHLGALALFFCAVFAQAQVQLGKGVQIGGTSSGGITALTGPVTASGTGSVATTITPTGVTAGTYNLGGQVVVIAASGQITAVGNPLSASFGCTQCGNYETGFPSITSASGTISYSNPSVPTSASVSDGTNTTTLSTPFTSWTLSHTYTTNTTFTLTAVGSGQTVTPSQSISFFPRTFGGAGTAGATGATASSTNAVLAGATGTLASAGLNNQSIYGPYTPSGQKIYILMIGNSHTFKDNSTGFAFVFNTPTLVNFVNQYGATVTMYLYESTNSLTGTFSILVAS